MIYIFKQCLKFLPTSSFKSIDPKKFHLNKYTSNSSEGCVLVDDLEYPKEWVPDKIQIKREMLSDYQLKIVDSYDIHIDNVKKVVPNLFDKKNMIHYENL